MKLLILSQVSKTKTSWLPFYEDVLKCFSVEYDIVFFDREKTGDIIISNNEYTFCSRIGGRFSRIFSYVRFSAFICKLMEKHNYNGIIVMSNTLAILLQRKLRKNYKNRYLIDYRDVTFLEQFSLFQKCIKKLVEDSYATFSSSQGFIGTAIPNIEKVLIVHNAPLEMKENKADFSSMSRIGFVGNVRYMDMNTKLIEAMNPHSEFTLYYIGEGDYSQQLHQYCIEKKKNRVHFSGRFNDADKPEIYTSIDIINALYDPDRYDVPFATPNKLYDAALYKKPILASKGTYLAELVEKYSLGCAIDMNAEPEKIYDQIFQYINSFSENEFMQGSSSLLKQVEEDMSKFRHILEQYLDALQNY